MDTFQTIIGDKKITVTLTVEDAAPPAACDPIGPAGFMYGLIGQDLGERAVEGMVVKDPGELPE